METLIRTIPPVGQEEKISVTGSAVQVRQLDVPGESTVPENPILRDGERRRVVRLREGTFFWPRTFEVLYLSNELAAAAGETIVLEVMHERQRPDDEGQRRPLREPKTLDAFNSIPAGQNEQINVVTSEFNSPARRVVLQWLNIISLGGEPFEVTQITAQDPRTAPGNTALYGPDRPALTSNSGRVDFVEIADALPDGFFPLTLFPRLRLVFHVGNTGAEDSGFQVRGEGYTL